MKMPRIAGRMTSGAVLVIILSLVAACGGDDGGGAATPTAAEPTLGSPVARDGTPEPSATAIPDEALPPVIAAREDLAARLDRTAEEVELVSVTPKQWADACLGLARAGEVCAQVITPGYEVVLRAEGRQYTYRTDQREHVRLERRWGDG